jgi:hypothetical protein
VIKNKISTSTTKAITTTTTTTTSRPSWSPWKTGNCKSECIKHSKGTKTNYRTCNRDGFCDGPSTEHDLCDDQNVCPVRKSITEYGTQKCRDFSRRVSTVDNKGIGLQARYEPLRLWMPCAIFCRHKNSTSYFSPRLELYELGIDPYFPDGTWCNREGNVNYYCLQHHCLPEVINGMNGMLSLFKIINFLLQYRTQSSANPQFNRLSMTKRLLHFASMIQLKTIRMPSL